MEIKSSKSTNTWLQRIVILVLSFGLALFVFSPSLFNALSPIDDHELVLHLQGKERLSVSQVIGLWQRDLSSTGRYRPVYNVLRPLELLVWGSHLNFWYLARICLFACSVYTCWFLLERILGAVLAGTISGWFFTLAFWADIIGRLGPSESYSLLGLLLWAWGVIRLYYQQEKRDRWSTLLLSVGCAISILSKENMIIMVVPTLGMYVLNRQTSRQPFLSILPVLVSFFSSIFVILYLLRLSSVVGVDVYGNSLGVSRIGLLLVMLQSKTVIGLLIGSAGFLWLARDVPSPIWKRYFAHLSWTWITAGTLFVSQFVFYNGQWPTNIRYDFPGLFYKLLIVVSLLFLFKRMVLDRLEARPSRVALFIVSVCIVIGVWQRSQLWVLKSRVQAYHALTQSYFMGLEAMRDVEETSDIILESSSINDLEIIHAIQVQFRQEKLPNSIYLRSHALHSTDDLSLGTQLQSSIQTTQNEGTDVITPLTKRDPRKACISIFLGTMTATECKPSKVIAVTW